MKISKKELVELLTEHLGSDDEAVLSQLEKMISDIHKAISKGEFFTINGFGKFSSGSNGIEFTVSPSFAAEINYTYEGMLPIDVDGSPAFLTDSDKPEKGKNSRKSTVVIVDEGVEGEEDPFGLPETEQKEPEFIDPLDFLNDLEGRNDDSNVVEEDSVFNEKDTTEEPDENTDQSNEDELIQIVKPPIDDSVEEEELELLESNSGIDPDEDEVRVATTTTDDPFGIPTVEEEVVSILDNHTSSEASETENQEADDSEAVLEDTESVSDEPEMVEKVAEKSPEKELEEAISGELMGDDFTADRSVKTNTALDEFFVEEPPKEVEGILHDSNREIEQVTTDGIDPVQPDHGPRVVSVEEDAKDNSLSITTVFRWVATILVVVLIAGGIYWFFTGPGRGVFSTFFSNSSQSTTQPIASVPDTELPESDLETDTPSEFSATPDSSVTGTSTELSGENTADGTVAQSESLVPITNDDVTAAVSVDTTPQEPAQTTQEAVNQTSTSGSMANYGLYGLEQPISGRVFSIIVHSLPSQISAQEQCNEITALNLRCLVREATGPQGRTTYRVGIGQFESLQAAESAVSQLPEPFRSRNFVARVN